MSYISKLRQKIGHQKFIHPAARIIIEDGAGKVLFIRRKDNGRLGLPAGGLEEGETITQCIIREVREETGLTISRPEVIGISSHPSRETVTYPNGDVIQYFTVEFYAGSWTGEIQGTSLEVKEVVFLPPEHAKMLPPNEQAIFLSLEHYRRFKFIRVS